jgi:hypothetical protein
VFSTQNLKLITQNFSLNLHLKILSLQLSEEQILSLAPDESSKKNGKALATLSKWVSKGANEKALWGECQGSGSKPYQTQIDLSTTSFKCSCPSRKFPCKHGLGLMLLFAKDNASFTDTTMPVWVEEWIGKRTERQEKQVAEKEKPVDEAAQAKRLKAREQKIKDGLDELMLWMKDLVGNGIMHIPEKGTATFENMARRMIDAQAPALAGMVRSAQNINYYAEGWQSALLDQLARIYLVASGYKRLDTLDPMLQQDIRTSIGFPQSQEALLEQQGVNDHWLVLAKEVTDEDNITTERYWLYGLHTQQTALILQFIVRGQGGQLTLMPGACIQAELVFYPSVSPLRALIKKQIASNDTTLPKAYKDWDEVFEAQASNFSKLPFKGYSPYIVENVRPVLNNQQWHLQDAKNCLMPLGKTFNNILLLLSLSGGDYATMCVIGGEKTFVPLGMWYNQTYRVF